MPSLMELVERVNKGEPVEDGLLEPYQESSNLAEQFLAHHAHAMLDLRRAQQHMRRALEAIDYSDQKVLNQYVTVGAFLGMGDQRAAAIVRFAASAIVRREAALGIEAIQNAVGFDLSQSGAYATDRANAHCIANLYERAAAAIVSPTAPTSVEWNNRQTRVAYVVSGLADDEPAGRFARGLARHHDGKRYKPFVYSTEACVRRDRQQFQQTVYLQPSARRATQTLETLAKSKVPAWLAPTDGDCASAARDLATQLVKDKIDVVIFDATQADPIASIVANWPVARAKVNLCRGVPLYAGDTNAAVAYVDATRFEADREFWSARGTRASYILEGIDTAEDLGPAPQRAAYGIPEQATVLATASQQLDRTLSEPFVEAVIAVLRANPLSVYVLIGEGELAAQKRRFESAGVGKRIGYAGRRRDLPGFLRIADAYLAEFPAASTSGVLHAMAVDRPVIAMAGGDDEVAGQAAAFVGSEAATTPADPAAYVNRVNALLRDATARQKLGKSLRARLNQHFGFAHTARHIEQLCDELLATAAAPAKGTKTNLDRAPLVAA